MFVSGYKHTIQRLVIGIVCSTMFCLGWIIGFVPKLGGFKNIDGEITTLNEVLG